MPRSDWRPSKSALKAEADKAGAKLISDPRLLSLVVNLNEYPSVVCGSFSSDFLRLPKEVLVTVMREHQKYFSLVDAEDRLVPRFLAVVDSDGAQCRTDPRGSRASAQSALGGRRFLLGC